MIRFQAFRAWFGAVRGGLGLATIGACAGFSAVCGSSVATAATMARIALPEMESAGYDRRYAAGAVAAGGTLGILIPPSVPLMIYGIITENDIGKLFVAGIISGILATALYMLTIRLIGWANPGAIPESPKVPWGEKLASLNGLRAVLAIFGIVIGGIYGGLFTVIEAAGAGAFASAIREKTAGCCCRTIGKSVSATSGRLPEPPWIFRAVRPKFTTQQPAAGCNFSRSNG